MTSRPKGRNHKQSDWHMEVAETDGVPRPKMSKTPDAVAERKRMALELAAKGMNKSQIARLMGVNRDTIKDYARTDPAFKELFERYQANRDEELADEMEELAIQIARGGEGVTKDGLPNYTAVKDVLKVTNQKRWGDKKQVEHSGTVIHTLIPTARRLDELSEGDVIDVPMVESGEED
jgi:predicted transcriptional regulator